MKELGGDPQHEPSATHTDVVGQLSRFTTQPVVSEQLWPAIKAPIAV